MGVNYEKDFNLKEFKGKKYIKLDPNERILLNEFNESDKIDTENLNKIAKIVIERIKDKLNGTDFQKEPLNIECQVEQLILQATNDENLCQLYIGWCPFW